MASGLSDYLRNKLLRHLAKVEVWVAPATHYFTLNAGAWASAGPTGEFASGNFARIAVTVNGANFDVTANVLALLLDQAGIVLNAQQAAGAVALSWSAWDSLAGGNLLYGGDLAGVDQKAYTTNDQLVAAASGSSISIT